jgi:hypothetical protein
MFSSTKASQNKVSKHPLRSPIDLVFESLQLYRSHLWLMVGYSAWLLLPFTAYFILSFFPGTNPLVLVLEFIFSLVELFITFWIGIIFIFIVHAIKEKQPVDLSVLKQKTLAILQPTVNVLLIQFLFVVLGFILLIIPGMIALVWYAFPQTAVILDDKKGMEAMKYSKSLTQGRFFRVAYRLIGGPIFIGIVYSILVAIVLSFASAFSNMDAITVTGSSNLPAWLDLLQSMVGIFTIPWLATYMTLLYKHLQETQNVTTSPQPAQDVTAETVSS